MHPSTFCQDNNVIDTSDQNPGQTREPFWASSLEHIVSLSAPRCLFKFMPIDLMSLCEEIADDNKPNFQMFINMFLCQYICIHIYWPICKYMHKSVYVCLYIQCQIDDADEAAEGTGW